MPDSESDKFLNFYIKLIKSDQDSKHHLEMLIKLLKVSIALSDESNPKLSMIIKDYLLTGTYNNQQGSILLKIAEEHSTLSEIEMFAVNANIVNWGIINKFCENSKKESSKIIMDSVYRIYGDQDQICGFRMNITRSPELQEAMCNLQQRRYLESLKCVQKYKDSCAKRARAQKKKNHDSNYEDPADLADILIDNPLNEDPIPDKFLEVFKYEKQNDKVFM